MGKLSKIAMLLCIGILIFTLAACEGMIPGISTPGGDNPTDSTDPTSGDGPHDHVFTEIIIKEATCTEDGQKDLVCDICGYTEGYPILAGHKYEQIPDKAPNCTTTGWQNYDKCTVCGEDFYTELEINPNLHDFDTAGICTRCGKDAYEGIKFSLSDNRKYYVVSGVENLSINEIRIPAQYKELDVKAIGYNAFWECQSTKIVLPDTITIIDSNAFSSCYNLTELVLPEGVTTIGSCAFSGCSSLIELNIPASVTEIGGEAFYGCGSLTTIHIPDGVTSLGDRMFAGCENLISITFGKGVKELGRFVFENCTALKDFIVNKENPYFKANGGALYSKDGTVLYAYGLGNTAASFTVPAGVKTIARNAFAYNEALTSVTLPEGLTHIEEYAFSSCTNLATINLPETLEYIGDSALQYLPLTTVVIPDNVTYLGASNFYQNNHLTSLTIGVGVIEIGGQVVGGCSNLTELIFKDPNNWHVEMKSVDLTAAELSGSASAIQYLRDTYYENNWEKYAQ